MGHSAPLTKIRYYGQNGQQILSASEFLLCAFSLFKQLLRAECLIFIRFGSYKFSNSDTPRVIWKSGEMRGFFLNTLGSIVDDIIFS